MDCVKRPNTLRYEDSRCVEDTVVDSDEVDAREYESPSLRGIVSLCQDGPDHFGSGEGA